MRFAELCAGSAVTTLQLIAGRHARAPLPYRGSKRGLAHAILAELGTAPGAGADGLLLVDPGPWSTAWRVLANEERRAVVVEEILAWADEEPRELWTRLAALRPLEADTPTPYQVAAWIVAASWAYRVGDPSSGFNSGVAFGRPATVTDHGGGPRTIRKIARDVARLPAFPTAPTIVRGSAAEVEPPADASTWIAYIDPPYVGTTPYEHELSRDQVIAIARRWAAAGATVGISETEPVEGLGAEWHAVDLTEDRHGQARSFSRQRREVLTLNRAPRRRAEQRQLFTPFAG